MSSNEKKIFYETHKSLSKISKRNLYTSFKILNIRTSMVWNEKPFFFNDRYLICFNQIPRDLINGNKYKY